MDVVICRDAERVGEVAADRVAQYLAGIPTPVLGLATGSSPLRLYAELARRVAAGTLDVSHGLGFALDEYAGLDPRHPESYRSVITRTVVEPLGMDPARVHVPDGTAADLQAAADRYDEAIAATGGVDVQVLGIGTNGHIGFNEPSELSVPEALALPTRRVSLHPMTTEDAARDFGSIEAVPRTALTMGVAPIVAARTILVLAFGAKKAEPVARALRGPMTAACPGSLLQSVADRVVWLLDDAAASGL